MDTHTQEDQRTERTCTKSISHEFGPLNAIAHKNTSGGRKVAREGGRHVKGQGNVWAVVVSSSVGQPDSVAPWYVGCLFKIVSSVSLKQPNLAYYCYTCFLRIFLPVVQYILQKPAKRKSIKDVGEFIALPATCYTAASHLLLLRECSQNQLASQPASKQAGPGQVG